LAIQLSANLIRNTGSGTATAEAKLVHRGRTTMVAETTVRDDQGRTLVIVTTTHIVLGATKDKQ
ncbi:MAG: PaaI family thioesterase, partial [Dehalococcoidia bacterium]